MLQPHVPQQSVVPLLVEEQLPAVPQARIDLAVLVEVRGVRPSAFPSVKVEDHAFADVDEEAHLVAASGRRVSTKHEKQEASSLLLQMLVASTQAILGTAHGLAAEDVRAKETQRRVSHVFAGRWTAAHHHLVKECIVEFW